MADRIRVRPFREDDREAVVALWNRTKRDAYPFLPDEQTRTLEEDGSFFRNSIQERCEIHVAERGGTVVGFLATAGSSYIDRLYIDPPEQRAGAGSALLAHARTLSPGELELHTHVRNTAACTFYEKHGFVAVEYGVSPPPENEPDVRYAWRSAPMSPFNARPAPGDYAPYYADYVALVPPGDLLEALTTQLDDWRRAVVRVPGEREDFSYAEGKWTVREVLRHVLEAERVFGYRALCFARRDPTPLPGYDQDLYAANGSGDRRPLPELMDAFEHLRRANLSLFGAFGAGDLAHHGVMWDKELTLLSLVCLVHGHAAHHLGVLRERYDV